MDLGWEVIAIVPEYIRGKEDLSQIAYIKRAIKPSISKKRNAH